MLLTHVPSLKRCSLAVCGILWLITPEAAAQVRAEVRLEKPRYIVGEPVFVIVDVTNVGSWPLAYADNPFSFPNGPTLSVEGVKRDRPLSDVLSSCGQLLFESLGSRPPLGWVDHPPLLMPGERRPLRYLLSGYTLGPGRYPVRVNGRLNLEWAHADYLDYVATIRGVERKELLSAPAPERKPGEPVEGTQVEQRLDLAIGTGSDQELRAAFAPYLADADGPDLLKRIDARLTILTLAPPVLEDSIIRFTRVGEDRLATIGAAALGRLATVRSRIVLRELITTTLDPSLQFAFVQALGAIGARDDLPFLATMLSAPEVPSMVKRPAALGLGHAGTDEAVGALSRALPTADPTLSISIIEGLGISRSRSAVPALIAAVERERKRDQSPHVDVCNALATLTHFRWCDGEQGQGRAELMARWKQWWAANGTTAPIYGNDACVAEEKLPRLQ